MRLGVNIDHVATIREARGTPYPDPIYAAVLAELGGADGITVHIRQDRRHIKERDILLLKEVVKTHLNIEASLNKEIQNFLIDVKPQWVCLVPERKEEITTEGGLDIGRFKAETKTVVERLKSAGINVSIFIEPEKNVVELAKEIGADAVEFHTGKYADNPIQNEINRIKDASEYGNSLGLEIHAGHGLHYRNIQPLLKIKEIEEFNIGHSIIAHSIFVGIERATREMKEIINGKKD